MITVLTIGYAMQVWFLDGRRYMANSILFGDQIRMRIIHYLASTLITASIVEYYLMHFILKIPARSTSCSAPFNIDRRLL